MECLIKYVAEECETIRHEVFNEIDDFNSLYKGKPKAGRWTYKDKFFDKIKVKVYEHADKGNELELTRKEMVDLIFELFNETHKTDVKVKKSPFMETQFGLVGLN